MIVAMKKRLTIFQAKTTTASMHDNNDIFEWPRFSTKVTSKVDPSDHKLKLFHTEQKKFLPTVFCK